MDKDGNGTSAWFKTQRDDNITVIYEGNVSRGYPEGKGAETWSNKIKFEGNFKNGEKDGVGKWIWHDGTIFYGPHKNGQFQGVVRVTPKNGISSYKEYRNGKEIREATEQEYTLGLK